MRSRRNEQDGQPGRAGPQAAAGATMRAVVHDRYGDPDVLELREVPVPAIGDGDVLVRVLAASVNPYDWVHVLGAPRLVRLTAGLRRPRQPIRGCDLAGRVAAVGRDVTRFRVGDEVFGMALAGGGYAEYARVDAAALVRKPAGPTFVEAAAVPMAALTALQGLRDRGRLEAGQHVLVNGASGGVGTFAVQLAKAFGAEVTGVCRDRNVDAVRALGADHVIDYTREDFAERAARYDLVLDIAGTRSLADRRRVLAPGGALVVVGGPKTNRWVGPMGDALKVLAAGALRARGQRLTGVLARASRPDLELLAEHLGAGTLRPLIERTHPLAEVPAAVRYVGAGHARGKVVIAVAA